MAKPMIVDGIHFPTKTAARTYVQQNIHSVYSDFQHLSREHLSFMIDLLRFHKDGANKIGVGIATMWIGPDNFGSNINTRCFWFERIDGTVDDFSFHKCIAQ